MPQETQWSFIGDLLLQAPQRFDFDLAHALTGEPDLVADLLQRERFLALEAVAQADDAGIALVDLLEKLQHQPKLLASSDRLFGLGLAMVGEELVQLDAFASIARRRLVGRVVSAHGAAHHIELANGNLQVAGELFQSCRSTELFLKPARRILPTRDEFDHVRRDVDRLHRIDQRALDRLLNPPRRVGREASTLRRIETLDRADKPDVAFLDQIRQRKAAVDIVFCDGDHQA